MVAVPHQRVKSSPKPAAPRAPTPSLRKHLLLHQLVPRDVLVALSSIPPTPGAFADAILQSGALDPVQLANAQAARLGVAAIDLESDPPDPSLTQRVDAAWAVKHRILPWRRRQNKTLILSYDPDFVEHQRPDLEQIFGPITIGITDAPGLAACQARVWERDLVQAAETLVPDPHSCRSLPFGWFRVALCLAGIALIFGFIAAPLVALTGLMALGTLALICGTGLKIAALLSKTRAPPGPNPAARGAAAQLPMISLFVPLFQEEEIASQLIMRLQRLDYPRHRMDVILAMEADDPTTAATIARTQLPAWFRVVIVPKGSIKTKPRAMNFALNFAKGEIIAVYDAEDAPEPGQLAAVVDHFAKAAPDVACLQGILDYYNARENWLSRCFAVEYATWFRLVLPALQRMGMPVPLGGTTLFFRRAVLEALGGWDAHNVTEDADLGVRLARHGYRTEMVQTVTYEEANNRFWPWVKQRSRWLKGFAITWLVHMRAPRALLTDLGWRGFVGIQLIFAVAILQFCLAPLLWTFWLVALGVYHPITTALPGGTILAMGGLFLLSEIISITAGMKAVTGPQHRHLMKWVPTMHLYFPLGALACYKALAELVVVPFYWDKTSHGHSKTSQLAAIATMPSVEDASQTLHLDEHSRLHTQLLRRLRKSP